MAGLAPLAQFRPRSLFRNTPGQALPLGDPYLYPGHVEPAALCGRVVPFDPLLAGSLRQEGRLRKAMPGCVGLRLSGTGTMLSASGYTSLAFPVPTKFFLQGHDRVVKTLPINLLGMNH